VSEQEIELQDYPEEMTEDSAPATVPASMELAEGFAVFNVPTTGEFDRLAEVLKDVPRTGVYNSVDGYATYKVPVTRTTAPVIVGICYTFGIPVQELVVRELNGIARATTRFIRERSDTLIVETSNNDPKFWDIHNALDSIPNRDYVGASESGQRAVMIPFSGEQCELVMPLILKYKFSVSSDLYKRIRQMAMSWRKTLELSTQVYGEMEVPGFGMTLLPYQKVAVAYGLLTERFILADVQGLGKTVEALALMMAAKAMPALIIAPAIARNVWARHIEKCCSGLVAAVVTPKDGVLPWALFDVVIVSYDALGNEDILKGIQIMKRRDPGLAMVIMDESQYIKNASANRTRAMLNVVQGVRYRLAVTGTPVQNRPDELIPQLIAIGRMDELGGRAWFNNRYGQYGLSITSSLGKELNRRLRQKCMIRRTADDVAVDLRNLKAGKLPRAVEYVDMNPAYKSEYDLALTDLLSWIAQQADAAFSEDNSFSATSSSEKGDFIEKKTAAASRAETLVRLNALRRIIGKAKVSAALDWIQRFQSDNPDEKLVVFCQHREVINALALELDGVIISGDVPEVKRQAAIDAFQDDPDVKIAFVSIAAAGMAITLHAASKELFVELDWSAGKLSQAEARCDRIGQHTPVQATYLVAETGYEGSGSKDEISIDFMLYGLLEQKFAMMSAITDGDGGSSQSGDVLGELIAQLAIRAARK
jgi:SWI/SNF-related matrix-associated actin-dependent regulator 1 of chromatin subfamily A